MITLRKVAGALVVGLLAAGVAGGEPRPQGSAVPGPKISVRAELVLVPVLVTDRTGAHVPDLTQEDFTVLEDGRAQKIAVFERVKTGAGLVKRGLSRENEFNNSVEAGLNRLTIIVLDMLNTTFSEQETAREQLLKFLAESLEATEPVCLMAIDEGGLKIIHDFTTEPAVLAEALQKVRARRSLIERMEPDLPASVLGRSRAVSQEVNQLLALNIATGIQAAYQRHGIRTTLQALRQIGEAFTGIPGRKSLIWATGGLPFVINDPSNFNRSTSNLLPLYENAWTALSRADIAVYPLDLKDLFVPGFVSPAFATAPAWRFAIGSSVSDMETFAQMTGGKMCYRRSNIASCFREAAKDSTDYYLLAFFADSGKAKSGWRKLSVRVRRPGLLVRARAGYFAKAGRDANSSREQDFASALASPLEYTALPLTVRWTGKSDAAGKKKIGFQFLLVPAAVTIDEADNNHLSLDFAAVAKTATGELAAHFSKSVEGSLNLETVSQVKARGITYEGQLEVAPGEYGVRFVVRDNLSGRMGTVSAPLKVP